MSRSLRLARRLDGSLAVVGMCVLLAVAGCRRSSVPGTPVWSDWEGWGYRTASQEPRGDFNVGFQLEGEPVGRARVAFCVRDPRNYYFLELSPEAGYVGRTESGVERALAFLPLDLSRLMGRPIVIERRSLRIGVLVGERIVLAVDDDLFRGGGVAFGGRRAGLRFRSVKVQPIGDIYFADDFMRSRDEAGHWRTMSGQWDIRVLKNPALSINAFNYTGTGKPGAAVTGQSFWGDAEFGLACQPSRASAAVGLYVAYRGPADYYLFRWTSRSSPKPARQLLRWRHGVQTLLAEAPGGYLPEQWYRLSAWYGGGWVEVKIDDTAVFRLADDGLTVGRIGMYVESDTPTDFDDVVVQSRPAFSDDFARPARGRWIAQGGSWRYLSDGAPWFAARAPRRMMVSSPRGTALNVADDDRWREGLFSADVGPWDRGALGLAFAIVDGADYYSAEWNESALELCKTVGGRRTVLASAPRAKPEGPARMSVRLDRERISLDIDGTPALAARDHELNGGQVALLGRNVGIGVFKDVVLRALPPVEPLLSVHDVFSKELSMAVWSDALSDWNIRPLTASTAASPAGPARARPRAGPVRRQPGPGVLDGCRWHRASVPGDVTLDLKLPEPLCAGASVRLLAAGDGDQPSSGYELVVQPSGDDKADAPGVFSLVLLRQGRPVAHAAFPWASGPDNVSLVRRGNLVAGAVGRREILRWLDASPPAGDRVGFASEGCPLSVTDFAVFSRNVRNYTFQSAPTDWRVGGGRWEVSNRWECDPRWSFFSGRGDGNVVLWNKRRFLGDVTLEFFAGIKMDNTRGNRYEYASDINATLCADGKDLTTGYSFVFGGHNNTVTRIYRGATVLAENSNALINTNSLHRYWYYVRLARRAGRLQMHIDDQLVLSVEDPRPLPGGQIAIWTRDNGIMVARVRASADEITDCEPPDVAVPEVCRSVYNPARPSAGPAPLASLHGPRR